jgi:archaellum component FlaD/FlaE
MGLRDVLLGFLSSAGSEDRGGRDPGSGSDRADDAGAAGDADATTAGEGDGTDDADPMAEQGFDVELEELDNEEQVEALEGRIEEIEGQMDEQSSELETIKGSQQDVAEQLNEVNDTVRQLLGIYDQLTADVNPFMDGSTRDADPNAEGFGVVGDEEPTTEEDVVEAGVDDGETTTIGLEDIKAAQTAEERSGTEATVIQEDEPADNEIEVEPTTGGASATESEAATEGVEEGSEWREDVEEPSRSTVTLAQLADTYATEIIVFEWLTGLVATAGPAATLRAIAYYEEIGWIDREVKEYLEDVLSGPDLDMNVDPSRDPNELTAEDHAESYEYIMKLDSVQRTIEDTGL